MSEELEQYVDKKVRFDFIPYDSPLFGLNKKELGDIPFSNKSTLIGVLEKNTGTYSHYALKFENGESMAIRDDQHKWIFNLKEIKGN